MESVTMTFLSANAAGAIRFLEKLIDRGWSDIEKAQVGNSPANAKEKGVKNSAVFKFGDAAAAKAFRQADKKTWANNFGITGTKYDPEN